MGTEPANLSYLLLQLLFIGTRRLIFNLNLFFPPLILRLPSCSLILPHPGLQYTHKMQTNFQY